MKFKQLLVVFLPIQIILFSIWANHTTWIESFYMPYVFFPVTSILRKLLGGIDFSVGLFLNYCLIVLLIFILIKFIQNYKPLKFKALLLNFFSFVSVVYFLFMLFWGLVYHRLPLENKLNLDVNDISKEEIINLAEEFIVKTNSSRAECGTQMCFETKTDAIFSQTTHSFDSLSLGINYKNPSLKKAVFSTILSYLGTSGIYYFFSGEANVNQNLYPFEVPFVSCHEVAHQLGFASEDEASYISFLACQNNPNPLFRYSANAEIMYKSLHTLAGLDSTLAKSLRTKISSDVKSDYNLANERWKKYQNPIEKYVSSFIYDVFLKSNGQSEGAKSYDKVIELIIGEKRKNILLP